MAKVKVPTCGYYVSGYTHIHVKQQIETKTVEITGGAWKGSKGKGDVVVGWGGGDYRQGSPKGVSYGWRRNACRSTLPTQTTFTGRI